MTRHSASLLLPATLLLCGLLSGSTAQNCFAAGPGPQQPPHKDLQYNRDVRPILLDACCSCHGPDSASRKADLRLDQFEAAVAAGAIVPGDPQASEINGLTLVSTLADAAKAMAPATGRINVWIASLIWLKAGTLSARNSIMINTPRMKDNASIAKKALDNS